MRLSRLIRAGAALALSFALVATSCGRSAPNNSVTPSGSANATALSTTTPAGTQPVDSITWALYRETNSLDPIYAFDYPENTVISLLCESLLRQAPDGSIGPGLASLDDSNPTSLVFTLKPGITFWDGNTVTPEDVVYSLLRNTDAKLGGFYGAVFSRVQSIQATGSNQVTVTLKEPDYWLIGELASMPGIILEKSFVESKGSDYGTPTGGAMCTGDYELQSWKPGDVLSTVRNDNYWDAGVKPMVSEIDFKGAPDEAAFTSAMQTGDIDGSFTFALSTLDQLEASDGVTVTLGSGWATDAFIVSNFKGPLGDQRVREALSLALDRQGIIDTVYKGAALLPHALSNPGTWGYGRAVFQQAYDALPPMTQDLQKAKELVQQAGATGETITLGMSSELNNIAVEAGAYRTAAAAIGLKANLKSVSAANYINFFIDPKARAGVDGFFTTNYGDYADPAAMLATLVLPDGSQNYAGYDNPEVVRLMDEARGTADPEVRAQKVAEVQKLIVQDLPWIPNALPASILLTNSKLTGAVASFAYMFAPWADQLGGTG